MDDQEHSYETRIRGFLLSLRGQAEPFTGINWRTARICIMSALLDRHPCGLDPLLPESALLLLGSVMIDHQPHVRWFEEMRRAAQVFLTETESPKLRTIICDSGTVFELGLPERGLTFFTDAINDEKEKDSLQRFFGHINDMYDLRHITITLLTKVPVEFIRK